MGMWDAEKVGTYKEYMFSGSHPWVMTCGNISSESVKKKKRKREISITYAQSWDNSIMYAIHTFLYMYTSLHCVFIVTIL